MSITTWRAVQFVTMCALLTVSCADILGFENGELRQPQSSVTAGGAGIGGNAGSASGGDGGSAGATGGTGGTCVPTTCMAEGAECGTLPDDECGQPLDCGNDCPMGEWCGGSGNNLCGDCMCSAGNCPTQPCPCSKPSCCTSAVPSCAINTSECSFQTTVSQTQFFCCP